jgi:mannose-1-phosphate guanylyltransferase
MSVRAGVDAALRGALVTFGVAPDFPHTQYGYIETTGSAGDAPIAVKRFIEKPSREDAAAFVESGRFFWNAGIFLFRAGMILELFQAHAPDILSCCRHALEEATTEGFLQLADSYEGAPSISLDYAIMEKARNIECVPLGSSTRLAIGP